MYNTKEDWNESEKEKICKQNRIFSENGLRVLSFAYKESDEPLSVDTEYNCIFLGLISMVDPPRPESVEAVADAKKAGVCLLALVIFVPFLHSVFSVENLSATAIAQIIGLSFIPTVIIQLIKVCRNKKGK